MANSYDVTQLGEDGNKLRLLISDVNTAAGKYIFEDEEVQAFLDLEGSVLLAAARALEVIAANEVLVQKRITILDLKTDGPAEAKELRALAETWRTQAAEAIALVEDEEDSGFDIAEVVYNDFTMRERLVNDLLRNN